ncbi:C-reactive protein-like [Thunnus albacares]|uniref:C-reactive protein-like n=1 Tax=Thunnus albacares TaxID=8236 RepID=UPI001CF67A4D|nr:C-reactive protein-like [Thunnus albacares]
MFKLVLLFLTVSGLQAVPDTAPIGLEMASSYKLPDDFQQGTEPSSRFLDDLNTSLVQKHISEMSRRADLSGKMFTFPQETDTAHVRLTTSRQVLSAGTVCFRSFTDLRRAHCFFSLATPSSTNDFLICKLDANDVFEFIIRGQWAGIGGQDYKLNMWHSICSTWDSASGLVQLWLDGKPSSRKFTSSGSNINGPIIIVLGQDQDSYGGGFVAQESFTGMMSDVHMWDDVISPCEIQKYVDDLSFTPGNVLNWKELEFQTIGRVLIEDKQMNCQ